MNEIFSRTSSSAVMMVGKPEEIKAILAGWIQQYGRDMPLAYILSLHDQPQFFRPRQDEFILSFGT
ncbi:hypothetical protein BK125_21040 [Paenibacillus odorifer]|uniref:hypothetical protein n=1 Tax=Paenibacillus odorifer TaxID=189426 RepID=UPI00096DD306|nr:hypothetical protein [Paenibacillus odorifer]OMC74287.1 hypothetical protein BK125_21040 [Paenibacillus odorifer]OME04983.1 hypothetical protein BSK54_02730 [Paenibacillus odorifer]